MRSSAIFLTGLTAVAYAQIDASIISQIPACATGPLIAGISSSGCEVTDAACICSNQKLISDLETAVRADCSEADLAKALAVTNQICPGVGGGASAAAASSTTSEPASSVPSAVSSSSSVAPSADITTDARSPIVTASMGTGTAMINYTATTGEYTAPATPTVTPSTGGAAQSFALGSMVVGIGALAMFFAGL